MQPPRPRRKPSKSTYRRAFIAVAILAVIVISGLVFHSLQQRETHEFSLKAYISDQPSHKVSVGDIIKMALYYIPGRDAESGLQASIKYDEGVTPIYDGDDVQIDTDMLASYVAVENLKDNKNQEPNWVIMAHDVAKRRTINLIGLDFGGTSTITQPGVLAYIYFKVNQDAPSRLRFTFNQDKTMINNNRPLETRDLTLEVER